MHIARVHADRAWFAAVYRCGAAAAAPLDIRVTEGAMQTWTVQVRLGDAVHDPTLPRL